MSVKLYTEIKKLILEDNILFSDPLSFLINVILAVTLVVILLVLYKIFSSSKKEVLNIKGIREGIERAIYQVTFESDYRNNFYKNFDKINEDFINNPALSHLWHEFKEHLVRDESKEPIFLNSVSPFSFFNADVILSEKGVNKTKISDTENKLVGLGIFGTFLGLTIGIIYLSISFSDDMTDMMGGIKKLLHGAGFSFVSSLAGVGLSLRFSYIKGEVFEDLKKSIHDFNVKLEKNLKFTPVEVFSYEISKTLKENKKVLEEIDEHLNLSIDKIPGKMTEGLTPIISKIAEAINSFNKSSSDIVGTQFKGTSSQVEKIISTLNDSVNEMKITQGELKNSFKDLFENVSKLTEENMKKTNEGLRGAIDQIGESQKRVQLESEQSLESFQRSVEFLSKSISNVKVFFDNFSSKIQIHSKTIDEMNRISDRNLEVLNKYHTLAESLNELSSNLKNFSESSKNYSSSLQKLSDGMSETFGKYEKRFQGVDENLKNFIDHLKQGVQESLNQLNNNFKGMQDQSKIICDSFGAAVNELKETVEEIQDSKK